jgi:hypothetical protein
VSFAELSRAQNCSRNLLPLHATTFLGIMLFTITFDAYQLFLIDKQLVSLGGQVVRSKRIPTVLLDERRVEGTDSRRATMVT